MGRDLIKEFIVKENNRNRSTSESAAYNINQNQKKLDSVNQYNQGEYGHEFEHKLNSSYVDSDTSAFGRLSDYERNLKLEKASPPIDHETDLLFDEHILQLSPGLGDDDTLGAVSEITNLSPCTARRLYEREVPKESIIMDSDQNDFAKFKAKFNSNIEALWKNDNIDEDVVDCAETKSAAITAIPALAYATTMSLPAVALFKENLKNFWENYYSSKIQQNDVMDENYTTSMVRNSSGGPFGEACTSDYFSMNSSIDCFDKSVGGSKKVCTGRITPVGLFLQNSIWSENTHPNYQDTDESFSLKIWNSVQSDPVKVSIYL